MTINPKADDDAAYNSHFTLGEVEAAISKLKKGKAPVPDSYPPEIFIYGGDYMREAILVLFSLSWSEGSLPDIWKSADIKFLRKPNKSDYYTTTAYRPISLTPCLAKLMEALVLTRLQSVIEGRKLIDPEQKGFRKNHSTTNAVLRFTESIADGFNKGLATAAIFVDLKGAFDRVWRNGLVHKLYKMGITGRMLRWVQNFLSSRTARCHIQDTAGPVFTTTVGLSQGTVLSPIFFNIYIKDMYENSGKHVKFADDGTNWKQDKDPLVAVQAVGRKAANWKQWCRKWNMTINFTKTEGTVFSLEQDLPIFSFKIGEETIGYNPTPKILGITLDEKLTFMEHLQNTEKKASRSLKIIREVKGIGRISAKKLLRLYSTLVRTIMEYGSTIWQCSKSTALLDRVQRKALFLCLGLPSTSSLEAMEVAAGILPLEFRFAETAVRDIAKIQSKSMDNPIKQTLSNCLQSPAGGR